MRRIPRALTAAQQSPSAEPYVRLLVSNRIAGVPRLRWTRLYTGLEEDYFHAATAPGDGSLLRARTTSGGQLYLQSVASPGQGSDFATWSNEGSVSDGAGVALTSLGSMALLFYVDADDVTIKVRESRDNGQSFGGATSVVTAGGAIKWLAAGVNPSGVVALFYTVGATMYAVKRTAGVWGQPSAWTNTAASITGLGCAYRLDWNLALTGSDAAGNQYLWTVLYGDGYGQSANTWSELNVLEPASSGSEVGFQAPFVDYMDVYRVFAVQTYAGAVSYSRPYWSAMPVFGDYADGYWREPVPFDLTSGYGVALAHGNGWLSTPFGVWQSALPAAYADISEDVLALSLRANPTEGSLSVTLRNDDGRYNDAAYQADGSALLSLGEEIQVSPDYRAAGRNLSARGPAYWVAGWEHRSAGGEATVTLHAVDGWGLLAGWRARRQFTWAAGSRNVFQILAFILARVGLRISANSTSDALGDLQPAFTIQPGESGKSAVLRLLDMVPDRLFFEGGIGVLVHPEASDKSGYSYGGSHALLEASYATQPLAVNQAQVHGNGVFAEAFDWGQIDLLDARARHVLDLNVDDASKATDRARYELRQQVVDAPAGHILTPVNCAQQLYDVIDVTDARCGLSAAKRRVVKLTLTYQRHPRSRYDMRLDLGGV